MPLLSPPELSDATRIPVEKIRSWIRDKSLRAVDISNSATPRWRIRPRGLGCIS